MFQQNLLAQMPAQTPEQNQQMASQMFLDGLSNDNAKTDFERGGGRFQKFVFSPD